MPLMYSGFEPQATDEQEPPLSLDHLLVSPYTFFVVMQGNAMIRAAIRHNDVLVIEPAKHYRNDQIVLVWFQHQALVRRLERQSGQFANGEPKYDLVPANPNYKTLTADETCLIRGRVKASLTLFENTRKDLRLVS